MLLSSFRLCLKGAPILAHLAFEPDFFRLTMFKPELFAEKGRSVERAMERDHDLALERAMERDHECMENKLMFGETMAAKKSG